MHSLFGVYTIHVPMTSSRRDARIVIVQTLFETDFHGIEPDSAHMTEVFNATAQEHNPALVENEYAQKVLHGIAGKYQEINSIIEKAAPDWPLEKIGSVDRNILRLGVFELLFGKELEVPGRVALNEAIEVTKMFLGDGARRFVNGVLGSIYTEVKDPAEDNFVPKKIKHKKSVGGVIFRIDESGNVWFAFVHDVFGKWTLSKGGLEEGEVLENGLKRVIKEEIDVDIETLEKIGSNAYKAHPPDGPVLKEVTYLLAKTDDATLKLKETEGLDEAKWFSFDEAKKLSFYPDLKQIILDGMMKAINTYAE